MLHKMVRKSEVMERIFYPGDSTKINIIPKGVNIDKLEFVAKPAEGVCVIDEKGYCLSLSEFLEG